MLYKRVLDDALVRQTYGQVVEADGTHVPCGLAPSRTRTEEDSLAPELRVEIRRQIETAIGSYFGRDVALGDLRVWRQSFGGVKPHFDVNSSAACVGAEHVFTLLIYLTDEFEGGELNVKCPRTTEDMDPEPEKRHRVFRFEPRAGFGLLFSKRYLHWAQEVCGDKAILLCDVASSFALRD